MSKAIKKRRVKKTPKAQKLTQEERQTILPELKIKTVLLRKLRRWKKNPRENKDAAVKLAALIRAHGFRVPIICTPDRRIWAGDTRYQAAVLLGLDRVPVIYTEFEDEAKAMMFALADNKSSEWARWDPDLLSEAFSEDRKMDIEEMNKLSAFSPLEIRKLTGADDAKPVAGEEGAPDGAEDDDGGTGWFRVVIVCRSDAEKKTLFRMLGIDGKKIVYTLDELKMLPEKKTIKKRKIGFGG